MYEKNFPPNISNVCYNSWKTSTKTPVVKVDRFENEPFTDLKKSLEIETHIFQSRSQVSSNNAVPTVIYVISIF